MTSDQSNQPANHAIKQSIPPLLEYPFLMPLVLECLSDHDVFCALVVTGKSMKSSLISYPIKRTIDYSLMSHFLDDSCRAEILPPAQPSRFGQVLDWFNQTINRPINPSNDQPVDPSIHQSIDQSNKQLIIYPSITRYCPGVIARVAEVTCVQSPNPLFRRKNIQSNSQSNNQSSNRMNHQSNDQSNNQSINQICFLRHYQALIVLPSTCRLTHLTFDRDFNQSINQFPSTLQYLNLGESFDQSISQTINPSVTHLVIGENFAQSLSRMAFPNLKRLDVTVKLTNIPFMWDLPLSLKHLQLIQICNWSPTCWIPSSVTHLTLDSYLLEPLPVGLLPVSLTHITFESKFDRSLLPSAIPRSVTHFTTGEHSRYPLSNGSIPDSVTNLIFGPFYTCRLKLGVIPSSVTHLSFLNPDYQLVDWNVVPFSITHLTIVCSKQIMPHNKEMSRLKYLKIGDRVVIGNSCDE